MRINFNKQAAIANNSLIKNENRLSVSLEKLSSGKKIVKSKDDPSAFAMGKRMNMQLAGVEVATNTSNDAISIMQIADGSLSEIHDMLQHLSELSIKASNDTLTEKDREIINKESMQLKDEINRMAKSTQFNGQNILDGSFAYKGYTNSNKNVKVLDYSDKMDAGSYEIKGLDVSFLKTVSNMGIEKKEISFENKNNIEIFKDGNKYMNISSIKIDENILSLKDNTGKEIRLEINESLNEDIKIDLPKIGALTMQVGANEGQTIDINLPEISLRSLNLQNLDLSNLEDAKNGIENVKEAIVKLSTIRSQIGAYQNRLEHTVNSLNITTENMTTAYSRIMDTDMAQEMTEYSTQQILSQAATSMLSQANDRPSQILQLLQ